MIKKYFAFLFLAFPIFLCAQETPITFPEDVGPNTVGIRYYCKPGVKGKSKSRGVEISYKYTGPAKIVGKNDEVEASTGKIKNHQAVTIKVKAPLINKPGFKLLIGYNHQPEVFHFNQYGSDFSNQFSHVSGQRLKNNALSLTSVKSFKTSYLTAKFNVASNGDYNNFMNFNKRYLAYNLILAYGIKKNSDLEYGFGIAATSSFNRKRVLPFFIYNRSFNKKWGIESVLPVRVMGRYNLDNKTIFLGGAQYNSKNFSITTPDPVDNVGNIYHLNHAEINTFLRVERNLSPWMWISAEAGYQYNLGSDFQSASDPMAPSFNVNAENNMFFKIGFFITPPGL